MKCCEKTACADLHFITEFFDANGIDKSTKFTVINGKEGLYVSWPLSKAIEIYKKVY